MSAARYKTRQAGPEAQGATRAPLKTLTGAASGRRSTARPARPVGHGRTPRQARRVSPSPWPVRAQDARPRPHHGPPGSRPGRRAPFRRQERNVPAKSGSGAGAQAWKRPLPAPLPKKGNSNTNNKTPAVVHFAGARGPLNGTQTAPLPPTARGVVSSCRSHHLGAPGCHCPAGPFWPWPGARAERAHGGGAQGAAGANPPSPHFPGPAPEARGRTNIITE